jgi:ketosteroid isomerase-like protein
VAQAQTAQANKELVTAGYEAFSRGDMETVRAMWTDDIEWVIPGRNPLAGTYRGPDAIMGFFAKLMDLSGGSFQLEVRDVMASDEHVAVLVHARAERAGRTLEGEAVHLWDMRGGKACRFVGLDDDPYGGDEFWS